MTYLQTNWITWNGVTFERSAAIALQQLDPAGRQRVMATLVRLRFEILKTPLNARTPDVVVLEHVQVNHLRVWYARNETDLLIKRFECTIPCGHPGTVHVLHRAEIPSPPIAPGDVTRHGPFGDLSLYGQGVPLARNGMGPSGHLAGSLPVAFLLALRNGGLQVVLDTRPDSALASQADWTAPHWPDAKNALMLEARLMLDLRLSRNAGIRGTFRIWHREDHGNDRTQTLPAPASRLGTHVTRVAARGPRLHDQADRAAASDHRQRARGRTMMQAMDLLSRGRTDDGWALCLDALRGAGDDVCYALSLDVALRKRTLRRRWQGKVDIEW